MKNRELTPKQEEKLVDSYGVDERDYKLFREGVQGFKDFRRDKYDTDSIANTYITATDKMIGLADGSIRERELEDPDAPEVSREAPDEIFFLDKSARPVSWMMDEFWDDFAKGDAKKPGRNFLNIDRVNWFVEQGHDRDAAERELGPVNFDINKVPQEHIDGIRALFSKGEITPEAATNKEMLHEQVWSAPTQLDGKNIMIMDEVRNKGGTLAIAQQLLKRAFPEAKGVTGNYFWQAGLDGKLYHNQETQMASAPVWYDSSDNRGRAVGDLSQAYYEKRYRENPSEGTLRRKLGWRVLSSPQLQSRLERAGPDEKTDKLRTEITQLHKDYTDGKLMRMPSRARELKEQSEIIAEQGFESPREASAWAFSSKALKKAVHKRRQLEK